MQMPTEVLRAEHVRQVTGHEGDLPDALPLAYNIEGYGELYRVEDVRRQWAGLDTLEENLAKFQKKKQSTISVGMVVYAVLEPKDEPTP